MTRELAGVAGLVAAAAIVVAAVVSPAASRLRGAPTATTAAVVATPSAPEGSVSFHAGKALPAVRPLPPLPPALPTSVSTTARPATRQLREPGVVVRTSSSPRQPTMPAIGPVDTELVASSVPLAPAAPTAVVTEPALTMAGSGRVSADVEPVAVATADEKRGRKTGVKAVAAKPATKTPASNARLEPDKGAKDAGPNDKGGNDKAAKGKGSPRD